jgi:hypothetical protein
MTGILVGGLILLAMVPVTFRPDLYRPDLFAATRPAVKEKRPNTFNDKQSQIAERKTGNGRGPGNHSHEAVEQLGPRPTPLTGRAHVGGGSRGKSPNPTPDS